jgi:WD40 repeat protein
MTTRRKGLSEEEARKAWRYAVETEFHSINPINATEKQILGHGTEERFLPFDHSVEKVWFTYSINANGQLLAIPDGNNVDIYDLDTGERTVMSGHISRVIKLGFSPTDPNCLVSWSETELRPNERHPEYNDIVIWNTREQRGLDQTRKPELIDNAAKAGVRAVEATLGPEMRMSMGERWDMRTLLNAIIKRNETRGRVPSTSRLDGRLNTMHHSPLFSNKGEYLIYLPGPEPWSSGVETYDICLYNLATRETTTLSGHMNTIDWIGFSPDDSRIASTGRDKVVRVHDLSGKEIWKWHGGLQNCGSVFSPDGRYLAALYSSGNLRVWDLISGKETAKYDTGLDVVSNTINWSPNGKYIVIGGDSDGWLRLFATSDGKLELIQERKLSLDQSILEADDPNARRALSRFLSVHSSNFLPSSDSNESSMRLMYAVRVDQGVEVFDFETGKAWRFAPPCNDDGSIQMIPAGHGESAVVGYFWRKQKGEMGVIAPNGIRFWRLD